MRQLNGLHRKPAHQNASRPIQELLFGAALAFATCICDSYDRVGSISGLASSPIRSTIVFVASAFIGTVLAMAIFRLFDKARIRPTHETVLSGRQTALYFAIPFVVICLAWFPWLITFFPGCSTFDGVRQLQCFYGYIPWTSHHPVFVSLVMGSLTQIGYTLSGSNAGAIFAYIGSYFVFQALTCALIAREALLVSKSKVAFSLAILFFALIPVFGANSQTLWKDGLYMCFFALFFMYFGRCILQLNEKREGRAVNTADLVKMLLAALLASLSRKEGVIVITLALICLAVTHQNVRKAALISACGLFASLMIWNNAITPMMGISPGSPAEGMSVPLQHVARVKTYHANEITEAHAEVLGKCFEDFEALPRLYNPDISDPVKNSFVRDELSSFLDVYPSILVHNPARLIDSMIASSYGYFYLGNYTSVYPTMVTFKDSTLESPYPYEHALEFESAREALTAYSVIWLDTPGLYLFVTPGLYVWIAMCIALYAQKRRDMTLFLLIVPIALTIAAACLSPMNGYLRYILGVVVVMPLLTGYALRPDSSIANGNYNPAPGR